ncbi:MAG: ornithine carbamoyltransferase [Veillonellaceae bacterium]|nr:ornithine carbamoyltransferase [Veillonellaceae bacterium]
MKGKDLLALHDLSPAEVEEIFRMAAELKQKVKDGVEHPLLKGKTLGMIFQKSSTRTRVSFEVGMYQLGGSALFLSANDLQMGRGEPIRDTARVLSRYLDGIMIRTFAQKDVEELAEWSSIPVINGLTDSHHPCQVLADLFTVREHRGTLKGLKLAFLGDGFNMANSLMEGGAKTGMHVMVATPPGYEPKPDIVEAAKAAAEETGGSVQVCNDPREAARDADVLVTDVWSSMGHEAEHRARLKAFGGYSLNSALVAIAKPKAMIQHCLPAHRGEEISDELFEAHAQEIFDEAENRLHVQKAIMALVM